MENVIKVEPVDRLRSIDNIEALAAGLLALGLSRRKVLDWLAELIFGWLEDGGTIVDEFGNELAFTDETIDDVHGKDATVRVISSIIVHASGKPRRRRARILMTSLLRVYDAAFKVAGKPLLPEARLAEVSLMKTIVRGFSPVQRARYVNGIRKLRQTHNGGRLAYYSAAVRRLRLRLAAEQELWCRQ